MVEMVETLKRDIDYFEKLEKQGIIVIGEKEIYINRDSLTSEEYSVIVCSMAESVERHKYGLFFPDKDKPGIGRHENAIHSFRVKAEIDYGYKHYPKKKKIDCYLDTVLYTDRTKTKVEKYISLRPLFSRYFVQVLRKRIQNRYVMIKSTASIL